MNFSLEEILAFDTVFNDSMQVCIESLIKKIRVNMREEDYTLFVQLLNILIDNCIKTERKIKLAIDYLPPVWKEELHKVNKNKKTFINIRRKIRNKGINFFS